MRLAALAVLLVMSSSCMFVFNGGDDDDCLLAEPAIAPAPLRDPANLTCQSFGGGCDPSCGPCPEYAARQPIPSWGMCGSRCEQLGETACAADPACRVVKDAACSIHLDCLTDFVGCFPTDEIIEPVDCFTADAWACSRNDACTALHTYEACPAVEGIDCPRPFALCIPEGTSPGQCHAEVTCRALPPACPTGTRAGVSSGCYTGACIPVELCEPTP